MAALAFVVWLLATLAWWAFAFVPLPSAPPPWLEAARHVCFGPMPRGWPEPAGWIMLVGAPLTSLGTLLALWGRQLAASLASLARRRA
ncbi:MAG TPA: hypothetical protein VFL90_09075, partial [Methylomirabilota bacterium]|nr:hypothetical protein [Methylomirabilota bacterium]